MYVGQWRSSPDRAAGDAARPLRCRADDRDRSSAPLGLGQVVATRRWWTHKPGGGDSPPHRRKRAWCSPIRVSATPSLVVSGRAPAGPRRCSSSMSTMAPIRLTPPFEMPSSEHALGRPRSLTLANSVTELSSRCRVVVETSADGVGLMRIPDRGVRVTEITLWQVATARARAVARLLAGLADPDQADAAADLPEQVRLVDLLGMPEPTSTSVATRWARNAGKDPHVPAGVTPLGPFEVSLVDDGPHALLAGTTGAGKSEFLRSLVASLAASQQPGRPDVRARRLQGWAAPSMSVPGCHIPSASSRTSTVISRSAALSCLEAELRYREEQLTCRRGVRSRCLPHERHRPSASQALRRRRRVRRTGQGATRVHGGADRCGPAGEEPRRAPAPGNPASAGSDQRPDPCQHQPSHCLAGAGRSRFERRDRDA